MRRTMEVGEVVLSSRARWQEVTPERQWAKDPAPLKVKEVEVEGRRYIVCLNQEEQRKDAHDRACILEALREQLHRGDKSLIGNKGYRKSNSLSKAPAFCFAVNSRAMPLKPSALPKSPSRPFYRKLPDPLAPRRSQM